MAKKLAARVRPARSESESDFDGSGKSKCKYQEDTTNIIQFNCAEVLDFSTGSVVLPLRITCYCRHHREKVGFNVHFAMMDHVGRIIGRGMTKPIMITDDHKTSSANKNSESSLIYPQSDWSQISRILNEASPGSGVRISRRKSELEGGGKSTKKRHKPYDASAKPSRACREDSISSAPSPAVHSPVSMTRASTPFQNKVSLDPISISQPPPLQCTVQGSDTSSPDSLATPLDNVSDVPMLPTGFDIPEVQPEQQCPASQASMLLYPPVLSNLSLANPLPFMIFEPNQPSQHMQMQAPIIHRLIPSSGPTFGGIEITILGANFHSTVPLTCKFGDVVATSTQRWSDNTLVCILPARVTPGVVPVWFDGFPKPEDSVPSPIFTYFDESDRTL